MDPDFMQAYSSVVMKQKRSEQNLKKLRMIQEYENAEKIEKKQEKTSKITL